MAFTVRTVNNAPLTRVREQSITTWALDTGVLEGMQLSGGAVGFEVDMTPGKCVINGILVEEDLQQDPLFTLPSPTNDEHHLIYLRFNPETDSAPVYRLESDRYDAANTGADIGDTDATDVGHSIVIGEIFVPSTASDIGDCAIINRELIEPDLQLLKRLGIQTDLRVDKAKVLESAGDYTLHFDNAQLIALTHNKQWEDIPKLKPGYTRQLITSANSTEGDYTSGNDYEITITPDANDNVIVFYTRDPEDFDGTLTDLDVYAVSFGDATPGTLPDITEIREVFGDAGTGAPISDWPDRQDFKNIFILGVVDLESTTGAVHLANGVSMRVGDEYSDGRVLAYLSEVTSTAYSTTGTVLAGSLDIDSVIDNAAVLHAATWDNVYDGFETGSADGAGRSSTVDREAWLVNHVAADSDPGDPWNAGMRFALDSGGSGEAGAHERAIDIFSEDQDSERLALVNRRPLYSDDLPGLLEGAIFNLSNSGGQVRVIIVGVTDQEWWEAHDSDYEYANSRWITFTDATGTANATSFRIRQDSSTDYLYLETIDGVDTIPATYAALFTALPETGVDGTVWEIHNQIGQTSVVQDLQIQGALTGAGGQPLVAQIHLFGYNSVQELIEDVDDGGDMQTSITGLGASYLNIPYMYLGQGFGLDRLAATVNEKASNITNCMSTDGRYVYVVGDFTTGSPVPVKVYNASDLSLVKTISTTNNANDGFNVSVVGNGEKVAIGFTDNGTTDPRVEFWNTGTGGMDWGSTITTSGVIEGMHLQDSRLTVVMSATSTDEMFIILATVNGAEVTSSSTLTASRRADDGRAIAAYGDKLVILSDAGGGVSYVTMLDPQYNIVFDGYNLTDIYDATAIAISDKYLWIMGDNSGGNLYLWQLVTSYTNIVLKDSVLLTVDNTALRSLETAAEFAVVRYRNLTSSTSELRVYMEQDISNEIYDDPISTATRSIRGICTDGQDMFYVDSVTNAMIPRSLGRRPSLWTRVNNRVGSTQFKPFNPYLAMPAQGF